MSNIYATATAALYHSTIEFTSDTDTNKFMNIYFLARYARPNRPHFVPFPDQTGFPNMVGGQEYILTPVYD